MFALKVRYYSNTKGRGVLYAGFIPLIVGILLAGFYISDSGGLTM